VLGEKSPRGGKKKNRTKLGELGKEKNKTSCKGGGNKGVSSETRTRGLEVVTKSHKGKKKGMRGNVRLGGRDQTGGCVSHMEKSDFS